MAEGDDESKCFKTTEEATRISVPVGSDTKGKRKAGIIPDVEYEDRSSKTSDSPETSMPPPRKPKGVLINPKLAVVEYEPQEFQEAYGEPPSVPYGLSANKYEWKRCLFHKPSESAMKPAKDQSPKDDNTLPSIPPKVPSRMSPIGSPSLEELTGEVSKMLSKPSKDSSPMPLTQPDPNISQTLPSPGHVSTPQSIKDTASTLPHVPTSTKDSTSILLPKLQKNTEAGALPSLQSKIPTPLPPILAKDKGSKVTSKVTIRPLDITRGNPERVSDYNNQQYVIN